METKRDCRFFKGSKPCAYHKSDGSVCASCRFYDGVKTRILVINLVGIGDVLRTTSLLEPLKAKYEGASIVFLTSQNVYDLLKNNPLIDELLALNLESSLRLQASKFDVLINLDKSAEAAALSCLIRADTKLGFGLKEDGLIFAMNPGSQAAMDMGLSDELKIANKKTQQQLMFEISEMEYNGQRPTLILSKEALDNAKKFLVKNNIKSEDLVVGFNTGCSKRVFPNREWTIEGFVGLAELLYNNLNARVILLGGPSEQEKNREIALKSQVPIINGGVHPIDDFAALVGSCDLIVSGDTSAVHIAVAQNRLVIAIFGCVNPNEIELYGDGRRIMSDLDCAPCYKQNCDKDIECMRKISADHVYKEIIGLLQEKKIAVKNRIVREVSEDD